MFMLIDRGQGVGEDPVMPRLSGPMEVRPAMTDHQQSEEELKAHLEEQISFLKASADSYDSGFEGEAKRIAVALRVLLHDTRSSASLLGQLGLKSGQFFDTSWPISPENMTPHSGLIVTAMGTAGARYVAFLDEGIEQPTLRSFDEWWNSPVFVDSQKRHISRKELVLAVANQDGGAHVDPALDRKYADLSRKNSLGWNISDGSREDPMGGPEKAALRQICHEALKTLVAGYEKQPVYPPDTVVFGGMAMHVVDSPEPPSVSQRSRPPKIGRNERCPCGSGIKHKRCCGALI
ncbi:YecA family protein [Xanthomonas campestris]|uniref:YecA family protein n=1 Tax=Xanthomonas campestris TaxID=339 RepID=UPI002368142B|nr:SEC-C metal-binding domain-containing protein [Xanthomonas campestris]WDI93605.1 SEC-C domain-containing protein [Xanthomonas campestris]